MDSLYKSNILVVDDNSDNLELIEDFLDDDGYENIICVVSANEAYEKLEEHNIDLIILDVMMPIINGIEACKHIKSNDEYKDIPIIIATAKSDIKTLQDGFLAGANDYVRKPITNDMELLARVKNALILKHNMNYIKELNSSLDAKVQDEIDKNKKKDLLFQEQTKLAAMGEMVGSIAHQWRQPLNALSINIQNLEDDFEEELINKEFIDKFIIQNKQIIDFMSNTIDDFRNFYRIDKEKITFSAKETIKHVINIQNSVLKDNNIDLTIEGNDFIIYGFQNEFSQVIINLINNAKDAFVENEISDAKIIIKLEDNEIYVVDNAGGIDENLLNRVFEPYFTTKEQGKGTGMGLYISKMIIEQNMEAQLYVENNDISGTTFMLSFHKEEI